MTKLARLSGVSAMVFLAACASRDDSTDPAPGATTTDTYLCVPAGSAYAARQKGQLLQVSRRVANAPALAEVITYNFDVPAEWPLRVDFGDESVDVWSDLTVCAVEN